ncbi:DUF6626 family protein [Pleomorphomonas carboxyditropha]|uniref:Uncharacterized protein n=1 Tax=Pleomorphomonas carboxyditropha TaxID=2023338 RepID=A0A2G9WQQ5_9HYPH|nr:DUF6626 family protein [Pleomorphomonas carboxyditropha]PIO97047.1 hypothetical protein CJ014_22370 [Pleomorphomonas carboxyditropha]
MNKEIKLLEDVYKQLRVAELVRSKGEFSKKFLGKSKSYLTSMAARQRHISSDVMVDLSEAIIAEIRAKRDDRYVADRIALRHAMIAVNGYLAEQTIPPCLKKSAPSLPAQIQPAPFPKISWMNSLIGIWQV